MSQIDLANNYRPNVGVVLFHPDGRVWYGRRAGQLKSAAGDEIEHRWQMPQGGVDNGEDITAAAFRELKEETGVVSARLLLITPGWLAYDFPSNYKRNDWKGQRQKWAAMVFEGADTEFDLEADDHQEFDAWRWGELEEAPSLIVPFKRKIYEELVTTFAPLRDFVRSAGKSE